MRHYHNNNGQNTYGHASVQPLRILHADGYVDVGGMLVFNYHLKDHLGNVRAVMQAQAGATTGGLVQSTDYYPYGMAYTIEASATKRSQTPEAIRFDPREAEESQSFTRSNPYFYNGKEEQPMPGKWLDYGFRFYDSQIARFHAIDPLATKNHQQTPYAYAMNNPLRYIDWLGLDTLSVTSPEPVKKDDVVVMDDGSTATANTDEVVVSPDKSSSDDQKSEETEANCNEKAMLSPSLPLPWYVGLSAVIEKSAIIRAFGPLIFLTIPGDTPNRHKEDFAQHGKNRGTLSQKELEVLKAKSEAGTLSGVEKQKLKRHKKNTRERRSRQRKDKK